MNKMIFVSNRLPVTAERRKGEIRYKQSMGGLATGLASFYQKHNCAWIGWCGMPSNVLSNEEKEKISRELREKYSNHALFLSRNDVKKHYQGFCNKTIWPLFHYFTECAVHEKELWKTYVKVNRIFRDAVLKVAEPGDTIWVHDYHLMLLPQMLREKLPDISIGFFLHIPFPSFEVFRLLPWKKEILEGLMGSDLIGFHTYDYARHFLSSIRRILGHEHVMGRVTSGNHVVSVDAFPMGIDFDRFANACKKPEVQKKIAQFRKRVGDRRVILSVDRLDYTKGILHRLESYNEFLKKYPEYKEKVTMVMIAVPSRTSVETYAQLKEDLDQLVGRVNGDHSNLGWNPVWYMYRGFPFKSLSAFYCLADIGLVTPLRDGMNLIAKEYMAARSKNEGVMILSEMAGATGEMAEALIVNPCNREEVAEAIKKALDMPLEEQKKRNSVMRERLERYNVEKWAGDFMDRLSHIKRHQKERLGRKLTEKTAGKIMEHFRESKRRLIFLDYDGTLVNFAGRPEKAGPDKELLNLLNKLTGKPDNHVVLISGRNKGTLNDWFSDLDIGMIAEHGVWYKARGEDWNTIKMLRADWKKQVFPILRLFVDRTPGSLLEEKDYSLVWHYRNASPELASVRVAELKDTIIHLVENLSLEVMDGNKVLEVKNAGINKGLAALQWIRGRKWDFILALGDDVTDEDMFEVLPETAYSIKVGLHPSKAKYNVNSVENVRELLSDLSRI